MLILVVDDDPMACEMTAAFLEEAQHQVLMAENGVEALETLAANPTVEMIISDMNMPLVSGVELFHALRSQGVGLPFILLSGDDPEAARAQEPDIDACLLKDISLADSLPEAVSAVMSARNG